MLRPGAGLAPVCLHQFWQHRHRRPTRSRPSWSSCVRRLSAWDHWLKVAMGEARWSRSRSGSLRQWRHLLGGRVKPDGGAAVPEPALSFAVSSGMSVISPVAILATMTAAPITSAGRFSPLGRWASAFTRVFSDEVPNLFLQLRGIIQVDDHERLPDDLLTDILGNFWPKGHECSPKPAHYVSFVISVFEKVVAHGTSSPCFPAKHIGAPDPMRQARQPCPEPWSTSRICSGLADGRGPRSTSVTSRDPGAHKRHANDSDCVVGPPGTRTGNQSAMSALL